MSKLTHTFNRRMERSSKSELLKQLNQSCDEYIQLSDNTTLSLVSLTGKILHEFLGQIWFHILHFPGEIIVQLVFLCHVLVGKCSVVVVNKLSE